MHPDGKWDAVRLERAGAPFAAVGVVHQAGHLPRADRAGEAAPKWVHERMHRTLKQEDYMGLEEVDDRVHDLYFCFFQIGRYELKTNKIYDIDSKVG